MTSKILFALFAVQLLSAVAGVDVEHEAAYDRVIECIKEGFDAAKKEALKAGSGPLDKKAALCHFWKAMHSCLVAPFSPPEGQSTEILDFFRAYEWQLGILSELSDLCTDPRLDELEALVKQSGIMDQENLPSIENDPYEPCAGDAHVKCMLGAERAWEHHDDDLHVFLANIKCYEAEAKKAAENEDKCSMLQHMNEFVQAFKKHLQENHGLLGNMVEEIKP